MHKSNGLTNGTILQCTKLNLDIFEDLEIGSLLTQCEMGQKFIVLTSLSRNFGHIRK